MECPKSLLEYQLVFVIGMASSVASWLPFARASAVGWVPLSRHPMPIQLPGVLGGGIPAAKSGEKLTLNVSGRHYEAWLQTIERFPDTLLGSEEREYFRDANTGEYFFDRDPDLFRYILNYYRTGRIHMPRDVCFTAFVDELAFFGIRTDVIADCCHEDYEDKYTHIALNITLCHRTP